MESTEGNLQNLVNDKNLKWIFVGGKGGVGKTTTSSSLSVLLSKTRENVEYSNIYKPILKCKLYRFSLSQQIQHIILATVSIKNSVKYLPKLMDLTIYLQWFLYSLTDHP